ncbi:MAG: hypothetical protein JOZ78_10730 [Chroococcidiopsidaceae cyanobacterium CP_BM_ER_R8_30]|nr:hypothetical protein [Chroococcidiopsidaceae cyanobacterium CP_BM_ER_R8_30]
MSFQQSLNTGNYWEEFIASRLLINRCPIWHPRQTEAECRGSFQENQTDLVTYVDGRWQALEVKSRKEPFDDVRKFPYPLIAVGSVEHWEAIRFQVYALIVVSQVTGVWGWVDYSQTRPLWQKRRLNDLAYCVPRTLFRRPSLLIQCLNIQVQSLPELCHPE